MQKVIEGPMIRIESTGIGRETKITHIPSGTDLGKCVKSITWNVDGPGLATVSLEIIAVLVDADVRGVLDSLEAVELSPQAEWASAVTQNAARLGAFSLD